MSQSNQSALVLPAEDVLRIEIGGFPPLCIAVCVLNLYIPFDLCESHCQPRPAFYVNIAVLKAMENDMRSLEGQEQDSDGSVDSCIQHMRGRRGGERHVSADEKHNCSGFNDGGTGEIALEKKDHSVLELIDADCEDENEDIAGQDKEEEVLCTQKKLHSATNM